MDSGGIDDPPGPLRAAKLWAGWHTTWGDEVALEPAAGDAVTGLVLRSRLHEVGEFAPPADPLPTSAEQAIARAWATVIAYDCPGTAATADGSMAEGSWRFTFAR